MLCNGDIVSPRMQVPVPIPATSSHFSSICLGLLDSRVGMWDSRVTAGDMFAATRLTPGRSSVTGGESCSF